MAVRFLIVALVVVVGACANPPEEASSTTESDQPPLAEPQAALAEMIEVMAEGDPVAVVDDRQVVLLAGAEGASTDELADLFTSIGGGRVTSNFWDGFAAGLAVDGIDPDQIQFGQVVEFEDGGVQRASVETWDAQREGVRVWQLVRRDGVWTVDLFATFGDVYAGPLRLLVRSLDPEADGYPQVSAALRDQVGSLEFAPPTEARIELSSELAQLP